MRLTNTRLGVVDEQTGLDPQEFRGRPTSEEYEKPNSQVSKVKEQHCSAQRRLRSLSPLRSPALSPSAFKLCIALTITDDLRR